MGELKLGSNGVGKIYLGNKLIVDSSPTVCNTDKYIIVKEGNGLYFIDVETLKCVKKTVLYEEDYGIKSFGKVLKVSQTGGFELYINNLRTKSEWFVNNYEDYRDIYYEDNIIAIANYNFAGNDHFVTLKVDYPVRTVLTKGDILDIGGYNDEGIFFVGKYRQYYILTFYNYNALLFVDENTLDVKTLYVGDDTVTNHVIVDDILYAITDANQNDSKIFKIGPDLNIIAQNDNFREEDNSSLNNYLFYFDDKLVTYSYDDNFRVYDKNLNLINYHYSDGGTVYDKIIINGKLWLINSNNGDIIIRNGYNDTNTNVVKRLTKDDGSSFTHILQECTTEIDFN